MKQSSVSLRRPVGRRLPALLAAIVSAALVAWPAFRPACQAAQIKTPSQYLGKEIGADGVLADYNEIWRYYTYADSVSEWIQVFDIGKTTLGNSFLMAVASEPANLTNLDRYRSIISDLRDARNISPGEARALAKEGKMILLDAGAIHSDEVGSTQMTLDLAYRIASGDEEITSYLKDVILLIMPSLNPDGHNMTVDFYNKWKGTDFDGSSTPYLYHPYAGHDNNRDWYMFNLTETKLVSKVMYETWIPQVMIDHHQMWMTGARLFVPPYSDPVNPNIDPILWREIELVCSAMHLNLQEGGARGVLHGASFPGWWEGAASMTPLWHNVVSILTEAASCRLATPVYVDPTELGAWGTGFPKYIRLTNFPDPWPGGWWRLRDIIEYDMASLIGALEACSRNKETILTNFYRMSASAIEKGKTEKPFAFVLPPSEDGFTLRRMIERLMLCGVEVNQATADFTVEGKTLPAGSYVIFLAQPYRAYAKDMLERQYYPEIRIAPEAPPLEPYDATAWTMPLKMGLECMEVESPFEVQVRTVERIGYTRSTVPRAQSGYLAVGRASLGAYVFLNRALKAGLDLYTNMDTLGAGTQVIVPGTILISLGKNPEAVRSKVDELGADLALTFTNAEVKDTSLIESFRPVRLAVYAPHLENESFGWLKYVLEDFEFEYKVIRNDDVKKGYLAKNFDAIIIHDIDPGIIKDGKPTGWWAEFFEPYPPEYSGGTGDDGVKAFKTFLEEGGTIIATAASCDFVLSSLELPAKDILKDVQEKAFSCPGAIITLVVDPANEIGWGLKPRTPCLFFYSKAFSTRVPYGKFAREVVATYADHDLLLSGWIHGEDMIQGKPAVACLGYGRGKVVISGFDPIHRAQTYSTYRILFNAILGASL